MKSLITLLSITLLTLVSCESNDSQEGNQLFKSIVAGDTLDLDVFSRVDEDKLFLYAFRELCDTSLASSLLCKENFHLFINTNSIYCIYYLDITKSGEKVGSTMYVPGASLVYYQVYKYGDWYYLFKHNNTKEDCIFSQIATAPEAKKLQELVKRKIEISESEWVD
jgi:hypothetical protein